MLQGFEDFTSDLTAEEIRLLVPFVVKGLKRHIGSDNAITNKEMCQGLNNFPPTSGFKVKPPKLRKIVQYIRVHGLVPRLASSSKGYYICNDDVKFKEYLESLMARIESMTLTYDALEYQLLNT
jgi:hypothetical protein